MVSEYLVSSLSNIDTSYCSKTSVDTGDSCGIPVKIGLIGAIRPVKARQAAWLLSMVCTNRQSEVGGSFSNSVLRDLSSYTLSKAPFKSSHKYETVWPLCLALSIVVAIGIQVPTADLFGLAPICHLWRRLGR